MFGRHSSRLQLILIKLNAPTSARSKTMVLKSRQGPSMTDFKLAGICSFVFWYFGRLFSTMQTHQNINKFQSSSLFNINKLWFSTPQVVYTWHKWNNKHSIIFVWYTKPYHYTFMQTKLNVLWRNRELKTNHWLNKIN